jgi:tRNA(fMet)-specific endonuclease VapC
LSELYYGAYYSKEKVKNAERVNKFCSLVNVLDFNEEEAKIFGEIKSNLKYSNKLIEDFDIAIASIAFVNDLKLVTNNEKHFSRIHRLKIENWLTT